LDKEKAAHEKTNTLANRAIFELGKVRAFREEKDNIVRAFQEEKDSILAKL
jgi:hypothetical protein